MTKLTIEICAENDYFARRVSDRIRRWLDSNQIIPDTGYVVGYTFGNGTVKVERIKDGDK
jgi:hypothetical protein